MNFKTETIKAKQGDVKGLPFGRGLEPLTRHMGGIHKGRMYGVAGPEKAGKSTFADYAFVLEPYLYAIDNGLNLTWDYYSFEIDRVSKEFDFAAFFMFNDYGIDSVELPKGIFVAGKNIIPISPDYLRGYLLDDKDNNIPISEEIYQLLIKVYKNRIAPMFGEYDIKGNLKKPGVINFITKKENPTGINKAAIATAKKEGTLHSVGGEYVGYTPNDPTLHRIIIIDHIRKLKTERGWTLKQTIDKMTDYCVEIKNVLGYTVVPILHTNRGLASVERLKHNRTNIYPTSEDLKDSGNMGEDCNYLLTIMNPNDDKYGLDKHFDFVIRDSKGRLNYPDLRTIHLASSRNAQFPRHFGVAMKGNIKTFSKINI